ncbi:hypothetical protein P692DRAFT_201873047 [Suillus brevipes Sb2]|nr:hypothetical protein P692DRAFT_201873047 [Suillus brevipes Sb2]
MTIANEVEQTINTNQLVEKITALMGGPIATLDKKVEALSEFTDKQTTALDKAMNEVREHITESSNGLEKAIEGAIQAKKTETPSGPLSYASVTKTGMPTPLTRLLSCSEAQARQILISKRFITGVNTLRDLTEVQLVAKAEIAIELLKNSGMALLTNMAVLSARKLTHGEILYELNNQEAVAWLSIPGKRSFFFKHFGVEVIIKDIYTNSSSKTSPSHSTQPLQWQSQMSRPKAASSQSQSSNLDISNLLLAET